MKRAHPVDHERRDRHRHGTERREHQVDQTTQSEGAKHEHRPRRIVHKPEQCDRTERRPDPDRTDQQSVATTGDIEMLLGEDDDKCAGRTRGQSGEKLSGGEGAQQWVPTQQQDDFSRIGPQPTSPGRTRKRRDPQPAQDHRAQSMGPGVDQEGRTVADRDDEDSRERCQHDLGEDSGRPDPRVRGDQRLLVDQRRQDRRSGGIEEDSPTDMANATADTAVGAPCQSANATARIIRHTSEPIMTRTRGHRSTSVPATGASSSTGRISATTTH